MVLKKTVAGDRGSLARSILLFSLPLVLAPDDMGREKCYILSTYMRQVML